MENIKQTIEKFIKGGDNSDPKALEEVLHPRYQNIQDGFFGNEGIFIISKEQYIKYVQEKTFGGKSRSIMYKSLSIKGNIAHAEVELESSALSFSSLIICVKEHGEWLVMTNIPSIIVKE
ncbi:hypothetical protein ACM46_15040 [Chryseobacterium angstadtii]|uniref:Lumazine-binding protein n=1 Tax=Chryseobacterium angstadtii TaxID=558151 RepID=A0A0J7I4N9_9FLAO|nr:nuclear transport factor 2 family protein [Chryseobacterium angstadtii]KMQ61348.1 hypothetical protein ACM46_15040 [Chryseobacterium angstadtii]